MKSTFSRVCVAAASSVLAAVLVSSPAVAASSARVSFAAPGQNTVVSTIVSLKDKDQLCYVSFYGPAAHQTPRARMTPYGTSAIRTVGLPAGRYSVYLNCGALQVSKQDLTVSGATRGTPSSTFVAPPRGSSLSSSMDFFGSS